MVLCPDGKYLVSECIQEFIVVVSLAIVFFIQKASYSASNFCFHCSPSLNDMFLIDYLNTLSDIE